MPTFWLLAVKDGWCFTPGELIWRSRAWTCRTGFPAMFLQLMVLSLVVYRKSGMNAVRVARASSLVTLEVTIRMPGSAPQIAFLTCCSRYLTTGLWSIWARGRVGFSLS